MKKLAKELLIVVVAICFTVGTFTALAGMPFLFGNIFGFNGNAFIVPNAGLNGLFGGPLGGVNPLNGAPGTTTVTPGAGGNGGGAGGGATVTPGAAGGNAGGGVVAPGGGANALPNAAALNQKVDIKDGSVDPMLAIVPTTGTVTWKNTTTKTYKIIDPLGGFSSPAIAPAGTFTSPAFNVVGMFKYTVNNTANANDVFSGGVSVFALPAGGAVVPGGMIIPQPAGVVILDSGVNPDNLTGPVGTIVTWTNKTTSPVVVKSATGLFVSPSIIPGGTYVYGFHAVDTYKYEVTGLPHSLSGMINIVAAPAGGVGPGAVVPANAQIIWATDTGFQPQLLVKPVGTTFTWKNISNDPLVITSQTPACIPSFNLPLGGVFTYTTTGVACSAKYTDQMNHLGGIKLN